MAVEALYLHIPFCRARCAYCDFDTCALDPAAFKLEATRYLAALERRIDEFGARGMLASVRTVYIGGGTPTVLGERLPGLVRRVRAKFAPFLRAEEKLTELIKEEGKKKEEGE